MPGDCGCCCCCCCSCCGLLFPFASSRAWPLVAPADALFDNVLISRPGEGQLEPDSGRPNPHPSSASTSLPYLDALSCWNSTSPTMFPRRSRPPATNHPRAQSLRESSNLLRRTLRWTRNSLFVVRIGQDNGREMLRSGGHVRSHSGVQ